MNLKEALIAVVQLNVPDLSVEKALIDRNMKGADEYTASNAKEIDLCAIDLLQGLLSSADVSEGGYSIKLDRSAIQSRLSLLAKKHNLPGFGPTVKNATYKW